MIVNVVGALGTALKDLKKRLAELDITGRIEIIQTITLLW